MIRRVAKVTSLAAAVGLMSLIVVAGASARVRAPYETPAVQYMPCSNGAQMIRPSGIYIFNCLDGYHLGGAANITRIHWTTYRHGGAAGRGRFLGRWCLVS
jgi:hypothetical protein